MSLPICSRGSPNHWHALAAIWAMQAGKDVYVEKPVSHNVCEGRRMVQVARKTGRICQGGTQNRSRGDLAAAAQYINEGKLGTISLIRSIVYGVVVASVRLGNVKSPVVSTSTFGLDLALSCTQHVQNYITIGIGFGIPVAVNLEITTFTTSIFVVGWPDSKDSAIRC